MGSNRMQRGVLYKAAERGRLKMTSLLLTMGQDPDAADTYGITPLQISAWNNHVGVLSKLATHSTDLDKTDRLGHTALYKAVYRGHLECLECLIAAGASINKQDNTGSSPLMIAVSQGSDDIITKLLKENVDVNAQNASGETALHQAVMICRPDIVYALLEKGANPHLMTRDTYSTPLSYAASLGPSSATTDIVKQLIKCDVNLEVQSVSLDAGRWQRLTPFKLAMFANNLPVAKLLATAGCNVSVVPLWIMDKNSEFDLQSQGISQLYPAALFTDQDFLESLMEQAKYPTRLSIQCRRVVRQSVFNTKNVDRLKIPTRIRSFLQYDDLNCI